MGVDVGTNAIVVDCMVGFQMKARSCVNRYETILNRPFVMIW